MWIRFSGILGLVIFLFGFISSLLIGSFQQGLLLIHIAAGLLLMLFWFITFGLKNLNQAGEVLKGRNVRYGTNALLYTAVVVGFLGVIYYLAHNHNKRWDLTENSVYSLSPQTAAVLSKLKEPLKIVGFKGVAQIDEDGLKDQLNLYKDFNPKLISADIIDARTKVHLLDKYEIKTGNVIYLQYGSDETKAAKSRINEITEQAITNAIIKLTRGASKKIYYVIGHDEPDIKSDQAPGMSAFAGAIADENLTLETILLSQNPKIPDDSAAVVLCSPKKALLAEEADVLKKYVEDGGRLLMFTDPKTTADVTNIAASFNIQIGDDVIIDQVQRLFSAPALGAQPIVRQYAAHPLTKNMRPEDITVFNIASSVQAKSQPEGATLTELAKTGTSAWGEKDLNRLFDEDNPSATFENGVDLPGPVSLAVAYEKKLTPPSDKKDGAEESFDKVARMVVYGDSDWILNANFSVYANRDLILNSINWLIGEEGGVSIGKSNMRKSDAPMTKEDFMLLLAASFVIPEAILILGLFIWWRRKHAYGA